MQCDILPKKLDLCASSSDLQTEALLTDAFLVPLGASREVANSAWEDIRQTRAEPGSDPLAPVLSCNAAHSIPREGTRSTCKAAGE